MEKKSEQSGVNKKRFELLIPKKKESAVDVVISNIKRLLQTKELLPGERLPNETELSQSLSVSRTAVREAMKIFSAFGIVEIRQGDGTYVSKSPNRMLFDPLFFSFILAEPDMKELVELRELMEIEVVKLVIKNADEGDMENLKNAYADIENKIRDGVKDPKILSQCDLNFHNALGNATKNKLVEKIYSFTIDFFAPSIEKTHENQSNGIIALDTHKNILNAIIERNENKAVSAVEDSVIAWKKLLFGSIRDV